MGHDPVITFIVVEARALFRMPANSRILNPTLLRTDLDRNAFSSSHTDQRIGIEIEYFLFIPQPDGSERRFGRRIGTEGNFRAGNVDLSSSAEQEWNRWPGMNLTEGSGTSAGTLQHEPETEQGDLFEWLRSVAEREGWIVDRDEPNETLAFTIPGGSRVTLEPGGQIELSTYPCSTAGEALQEVERFEKSVRMALPPDCRMASFGFDQSALQKEHELVVPKPRYLLMDQHFRSIGTFGQLMMRSTCSMQINIDFGPDDGRLDRWRKANIIAPLIAEIYSTSCCEHQGVRYTNFRRQIWNRTDPCRTGIPDGMIGDDPVGAYLHFALDASLIFIDDARGPRRPQRPMSFREWMEEGEVGGTGRTYPDLTDWHTHLSTLFPSVRPRGFIEIRSIDGMEGEKRREAVHLVERLMYGVDS